MPAQKSSDQLLEALAKQLDLVMLTRERIQQTLDEAAERGRVTRSDANLLVSELVRRGRVQSDEMARELEAVINRGRESLESASRRARRVVGSGGDAPPIDGYDGLTAARVRARLGDLRSPELRRVRDYERRHANRKTVLRAIDRALGD